MSLISNIFPFVSFFYQGKDGVKGEQGSPGLPGPPGPGAFPESPLPFNEVREEMVSVTFRSSGMPGLSLTSPLYMLSKGTA